MSRPRVVLLRGHQANIWDLRPWEDILDAFDVTCLVPGGNLYGVDGLAVPESRIRALSDVLPRGRLHRLATRAPVNRYVRLADHLDGAAIVHSVELSPWFSFQASRLKPRLGFKLVLTVWETIPFLETYRNLLSRRNRRAVIEAADLFLAATDRARQSLLLEGVPNEKIEVSPPGVDLERFGAVGRTAPQQEGQVILSPGRLVWEKGHQDVLRALAALRFGLVAAPPEVVSTARVLVVGMGPEESRLRRLARELGLSSHVDFRYVAGYDQMPAAYAEATCVVMASLSTRTWEEQFGLVLAEAMAAGLPIVASTSGAIPEVLDGTGAHFAPGDWLGLAKRLAAHALDGTSPGRVEYPPELLNRYSRQAAAKRLVSAYSRLLAH